MVILLLECTFAPVIIKDVCIVWDLEITKLRTSSLDGLTITYASLNDSIIKAFPFRDVKLPEVIADCDL